MFRLVTSNNAGTLADALGDGLRDPRGNPLLPSLVLVPQAGLRRWLQVHLAERLGVIANVEFRAPAEFAWDLLRAAQPDLPRRSPFDPDVLRWHLHALLGEPLDGAALATLRGYLQSDGDLRRRYALAGELAHVFERMQGYRRAKLLRWERGPDPQDWQAELWRRLITRTGGASRAGRVEEWLRDFDPGYPPGAATDKPPPPGLPARLACFACANISPDVLRMLAVAGLHCDIDFYLPLPSREYLGDLPRSRQEVRERLAEGSGENSLVLSMATASREFLELLYDYGCVQPDSESERFDESIARDTLLGRVRDDILAHRAAREDDRVALPDDSMQFHACHTELREVQTLHDRLLAMFTADPTLKPREIAVMMPDVAAYRPAIEAVFGSLSDHDPRFIPYNLGDLAAGAAHPAARLFLTLLDAPTSRWRLSEILDVLSVPGVMRRLELDASELEQLSRQLKESGVRWGEDEHARAQVGGYREFSFAFGLDRMLAGFACGDDEALVAGTAPLPSVEGAAFARIDALLAVLDAWKRLREFASQEMNAGEWQRALNGLFDALYASDPRDIAEARALERMRGALEDLVEQTRAAQLQQPLAWHDLRAFLRERMDDADPRQQLFSGGVTFCGMVPLRVVPFRVICLLGMDEAAFPRRDPSGLDPLSADRRSGHAQRGDRSVRDDDRLLFLQLIAAACDGLYISWIGRDAHSNETLAPSVVVAELMDVLREGYLAPDEDSRAARDALLPRVQPLHPFDASLFDARAPRSYRNEWLAAASTPDAHAADAPFMQDARLPRSEVVEATALTLEQLSRFLLDPARGFLEQGLGLALPREQRADTDDEPLSPSDGLTRWSLTRALLDFGEGNASGDRDLLRARGQLPPGTLGDEALRDAHVQADALRAAVLAFTGGASPLPAATLRLDWDDGTRLEGAPADPYPNGVLHVRPGGIDGRHVLRAWLDALLCAAGGMDKPVVLVGRDEHDACSFALPQLAAESARDELRALVELHRDGRRAPLPFFVRASWKHALVYARAEKKSGAPLGQVDIGVFEKAAKQAEVDHGFGGFDEFGQDAVCMAWRGRDLPGPADGDLVQDLHRLALAVFAQPARAWVEQFP